jgi:hypothetical protein
MKSRKEKGRQAGKGEGKRISAQITSNRPSPVTFTNYTTLPSHDESEEEEERSDMKNRTWVSQGGQAHETVINAHISDMYRTCYGFKNEIISFCKNTPKLISIKLIFIVGNEVVFYL